MGIAETSQGKGGCWAGATNPFFPLFLKQNFYEAKALVYKRSRYIVVGRFLSLVYSLWNVMLQFSVATAVRCDGGFVDARFSIEIENRVPSIRNPV